MLKFSPFHKNIKSWFMYEKNKENLLFIKKNDSIAFLAVIYDYAYLDYILMIDYYKNLKIKWGHILWR